MRDGGTVRTATSPFTQVLSAVSAGVATLDSVVPDGLWLVEVSRGWSMMRDDDGLYWTSAMTPLGSSCIAWADNDEERPQACLAISKCGVRFLRADDVSLSLAKQAITVLVNALGAIVNDREAADKVGLHVTGHDAMELYETLQSWIQRLTMAAAKALGVSTTETWEQISRVDGGRAAA